MRCVYFGNIVKRIAGKGQSKFHKNMFLFAKDYFQKLKEPCMLPPSLEMHVQQPNVHGLREHTGHLVLLYSHGRFINRMMFDAVHQAIKWPLSPYTNSIAHKCAINHILTKDCLARAYFKSGTNSRTCVKGGCSGFLPHWLWDLCWNRLKTALCGKE